MLKCKIPERALLNGAICKRFSKVSRRWRCAACHLSQVFTETLFLFKHVAKRMRSYLSGLRINITLIFKSSSSYLVHAISCRIILLKYRFFFFLVSTFYFWRPDNLSPVTHHPPPAIRHPLPLTRYPSPATRHPSPVTRGKVLPFLPKGQVSGGGRATSHTFP